jgi:hypothetical protein
VQVVEHTLPPPEHTLGVLAAAVGQLVAERAVLDELEDEVCVAAVHAEAAQADEAGVVHAPEDGHLHALHSRRVAVDHCAVDGLAPDSVLLREPGCSPLERSVFVHCNKRRHGVADVDGQRFCSLHPRAWAGP